MANNEKSLIRSEFKVHKLNVPGMQKSGDCETRNRIATPSDVGALETDL